MGIHITRNKTYSEDGAVFGHFFTVNIWALRNSTFWIVAARSSYIIYVLTL